MEEPETISKKEFAMMMDDLLARGLIKVVGYTDEGERIFDVADRPLVVVQ